MARNDPSPNDWDIFEAKVAAGEDPARVARERGHTSLDFKRDDPVRHAVALEHRREMQINYVADNLKRNIETAQSNGELAVANRALELLGKHAGMFVERQQVELTGIDGGAIEIEDRSSSLDDVLALLVQVGAVPDALDGGGALELEVAGAEDVLPDRSDG